MSTGARGYRLFSFLFSGHRRLLWRISIITIINTVGYYHTAGRKYTNDILLEYTRISRPLLCYSIVSRGLISACFSIVIIFVYLRPLRLLFSILKFFFFFWSTILPGAPASLYYYTSSITATIPAGSPSNDAHKYGTEIETNRVHGSEGNL